MSTLLIGALTSLGLGALTIIHPCPLSTNIAAVSFLFGWEQNSRTKLFTASLFVLGEIVTFAVLGSLISFGILAISPAANFLQVYIRQLFGPILILSGMMLLGILLPRQSTLRISEHLLPKIPKFGKLGGLILGIMVALAFCPMSAAIYFGVLIPLAISNHTVVLYPVLFGIGASLPLLFIVIIVSKSAVLINRTFLMKKSVEKTLKEMASIVMIILGIYMSLRYIFKLF